MNTNLKKTVHTPPLSHRRRRGQTRLMIYDFINAYCDRYGYPPTIREIGDAVGVSSTGTVVRHLRVLEQEHLIERRNNCARAIRTQSIL